jgi:hypothetical protein
MGPSTILTGTTFTLQGATHLNVPGTTAYNENTGIRMNFAHYTRDKVCIEAKSILYARPEGEYRVTMIKPYKSSNTLKKESVAQSVLCSLPTGLDVMSSGIIYESNKSKSGTTSEKYLTGFITPGVPAAGMAFVIGNTYFFTGKNDDLNMSMARPDDPGQIYDKNLRKAGKTDVKFEVNMFGEDQKSASTANMCPEEPASPFHYHSSYSR